MGEKSAVKSLARPTSSAEVKDKSWVMGEFATEPGRTDGRQFEMTFDTVEKSHRGAHSFTMFYICSISHPPSLGIIL
jgi:hypothetical protein